MTKSKLDEFLERQKRQVNIYEFEKQINQEIATEAKRPIWVKKAEYGDYMADGSDDQGWDVEEEA